MQGSVWADPKPAYAMGSQWDHPDAVAAAALASSGHSGQFSPDILAAFGGGGDHSAAALGGKGGPVPGISLPPPPSMPPPPAPRKGGPPKADSSSMMRPKAPPGKGMQTQVQAAMSGAIPAYPVVQSGVIPGLPSMSGLEPVSRPDRNRGFVAPIGRAPGPPGPPSIGRPTADFPSMGRPAASLLPEQEFIPINTNSPSFDNMQVFGDSPFTSSLFASPFAMFGPVTGYGGESPSGGGASGLLADLHADSQPVQHATGRAPKGPGSQHGQ